MNITEHIETRLGELGVAQPPPRLVAALEKKLEPKVASMVSRGLSRRVIVAAFAEMLAPVQSSGEVEEGASPFSQSAASAQRTDDVAEGKSEGLAGAEGTTTEENHG